MIELAPSILSADFAHLGDAATAAVRGGATVIHCDVMDGHFVPNLTIGPPVVASLRKVVEVPLDCHLMIENPDEFIPAFADAGASWISVHQEVCRHLNRTLDQIRIHGCKVGVVLNPATPLNWLDYVIEKLDLILVMSVNPGFGGQKFIPGALQKLAAVRQRITACGKDIHLQVDGGIKVENAGDAARAGADTFVSGSAIFGASNYAATITAMRAQIGIGTGK